MQNRICHDFPASIIALTSLLYYFRVYYTINEGRANRSRPLVLAQEDPQEKSDASGGHGEEYAKGA